MPRQDSLLLLEDGDRTSAPEKSIRSLDTEVAAAEDRDARPALQVRRDPAQIGKRPEAKDIRRAVQTWNRRHERLRTGRVDQAVVGHRLVVERDDVLAGIDTADVGAGWRLAAVDVLEKFSTLAVERLERGDFPRDVIRESADRVVDRAAALEQHDLRGFVDFAGASGGGRTAQRSSDDQNRSRHAP